MKVKVNVEGSDKDFVFEVGPVIVLLGFFMVVELKGDKTIFRINFVCFDVLLDLLIFEIFVNHVGLHGLLNVLDVEGLTVLDL